MYEMGTVELIERLSIALAIGLLIGLERGWRARDEAEGERAAGLRTHALAALLGGVWAAIAQPYGGAGVIALAIAFVFVGALIGVYRYRETEHDATFGATTVVAVSLAFALGAFAVIGDIQAAAAAAVATTALLALKSFLHGIVKRMTWDELRSGLALLAMSFILLPVLPNRAIDRWGAINPFELWLLTVFIAVISFAGYVAVKLVGYRRGLAVAGMAGGLASSTAATATMSRLARENPAAIDALAAAAIFANAVMAPRILIVLGLLNFDMALKLAPPLVAGGLVYTLAGFVLMRRNGGAAREGESALTIKNPLDFESVFRFGALLALVMVLARVVARFAGSGGVFALAAASGVADVDAITLAMARQGGVEIGAGAAVAAVLIAVASNTAAKAAIGHVLGGAAMGARLIAVSALAILAGAAAYYLSPL